MLKRLHYFLLLVPIIVACDPGKKDDPFNNNNTNNNTTTNSAQCVEGSKSCSFNSIVTCVGGQWQYNEACGTGALAPICDPNNGSPRCVDCYPGGTVCGDGDNAIHTCTADGTVGLVTETCDTAAGEECLNINQNAQCDSPCIRAANTKSYRGCEYWAVSMVNGQLDPAFDNNFAIAVDNSNSVAATVNIQGAGVNISESVPANTLRVFTMGYNQDIKMAGGGDTLASGIYRTAESRGAFHVTTTLPVTVYQFNPYDFVMSGTNSYSNDASLVLPVSVLSTNYIVMSRPTMVLGDAFFGDTLTSPGAVTVVATDDNTQVTFDSKAYTAAGGTVAALSPGGQGTYTLNKGDVLQLVTATNIDISDCPTSTTSSDGNYDYCDPGANYDLTGSYISTTKPVAVWGGHSCDFIPYDKWACDHLEEMMFPLETWGKNFYVGTTQQIENGSIETNMIRILSGEDNVTVNFNPASVHSSVTLHTGQYVEFLAPANSNFEINSTGPIMVGKFTVGQNMWTDDQGSMGDPAFGLVVPVEQFRSEYTFTTPPSMTINYVNVTAVIPSDNTGTITLDGQVIPPSSFIPIGDTGWGVAKVNVTSTGTNGAHYITSDSEDTTFGIEVYGFASYTSYLYPGGLDLEYINPVE
ncbi:IgGFc-binding protein [Myxococcota bacterium]|nr:IgGFc-binding protein [Myxococcota bacterium]MBU1382927.1 IgGFc-binding protein [Myxococcota bacterium]MBU1496918.1 IgGFc-binding protein [Myxococcota bacterium]